MSILCLILLLRRHLLIPQLILGIPLVGLGIWQCVDAWNENSRLFKTPDKIKGFFKNMVEKESGLSSFLLGSSFTVLKAPCIAGILLSLVFSINQTGAFSLGRILFALGLFSIGVLIPILTVFGILRWRYIAVVTRSSLKIQKNNLSNGLLNYIDGFFSHLFFS